MPRPTLIDYLNYYAFRGASGLLNILPFRLSSFVVRQFTAGFYRTPSWVPILGRAATRLRDRIRSNIESCFSELSPSELEELSRQAVDHFFQLILEFLCFTSRLKRDNWQTFIKGGNVAESEEILFSDQPSILVTGHNGNWEVLGYYIAMRDVNISVVARPLNNPLINNWVIRQREISGLGVISKFGATNSAMEAIETTETNRGGPAIAFVADQDAGPKGLFVPYFGRLASTYKSIGLLAMHHEVPVICGIGIRTGLLRFRVEVQDIIYPKDWQAETDPLYYITARYVRAIEQMVRREPAQYLWTHRRWKSRPKFEQQGNPMPASLAEKIQSLPWMDQQQFDALNIHHEDAVCAH